MSGNKFNAKKCPLELIDPLALEGLGWALYYGKEKYAADNWARGLSWREVIGAIMRHLQAIARGEDMDPESGIPHIDCVGAEWMFLSAFMKENLGIDDRRQVTRADGWTSADIKPPPQRLSAPAAVQPYNVLTPPPTVYSRTPKSDVPVPEPETSY